MTTPVQLVIEGQDNSGGAFSSAQSNLSKIGQIAAGILTSQVFTKLAQGVVNFGKDIINTAMESQDVLAQLNSVLESTGGVAGVTADMVNEYAQAIQKTTRFDDEAATSASTLLLQFTKIGKDVFPQALQAATDLATRMKTDLPSAAMLVGKALGNPEEGIGRLNMAYKLFDKEQLKFVEDMAKSGDIAGAQTLILDALNKAVGGAAVAAGQTFAGRLDILKNRLSNVKETIGLALIPIIERLMDKFMPLIPVIEDMATRFSDFLTQTKETGTGIQNFVSGALEFFSGWWADNGDGITSAVNGIFGGIKKLADEIGPTLGPLVSDILAKFGTWFTENGPLIQATIQKIADNFNTYLVPIIITVWNTLQPILKGFIDLILGLGTIVMQIFTGDWAGAWETAKQIVAGVFESLVQAAMNLISGLLGVFGTSVPQIASSIQTGFENAKTIVVNTFENMKLSISTKFSEIKTTIAAKIADVITEIRNKISQFQTLGSNIVLAIKTGISGAWGSFVDWIIGMVQGIIDDLIAAATGGGTSGSTGSSSSSSSQAQSTAAAIARVTNNSSNSMWNFGTIYNGNGYPGMNVLDALG